jgi:hypothetical protein
VSPSFFTRPIALTPQLPSFLFREAFLGKTATQNPGELIQRQSHNFQFYLLKATLIKTMKLVIITFAITAAAVGGAAKHDDENGDIGPERRKLQTDLLTLIPTLSPSFYPTYYINNADNDPVSKPPSLEESHR